MTGLWVTVPPEGAERLSDEVRSFANEFMPVPGEVDETTRGQAADRDRAPAREAPKEESPTPRHGDKLK